MKNRIASSCLGLLLATASTQQAMAAASGAAAQENSAAPRPPEAKLTIRANERSPHPIPRFITGKFCEHLGANIYNGMLAQVLRNPTLADYPFSSGQTTPDGVVTFHFDREQISRAIRQRAVRFGWPEAELDRLIESYNDSLACWWTREGSRDSVRVSPDTGPRGGRAQRIETSAAGQGIAQWTYLPLHRVRKFNIELVVRSPDITSLSVSLSRVGRIEPCAQTVVKRLSRKWQKLTGSLEIGPQEPDNAAYKLAVIADAPGQFVIERILLWPADNINGADPDVVRFLMESCLPILRWPGGNFVSGYHWQDGIGPAEQRPTVPNYAWGGVEPNLFGTDEFIAFCRAVGCEPMICINAGNGTPQEAAQWIEYCNGPADSTMGARRAANGHTEPYNIRHWEVGNELWGRWQVHWTTAAGYVDRLAEFVPAMLAADPSIQLYACGAPVMWGKNWNDTLIAGAASIFNTTTDHPLIGGSVSPTAEPLDVYRDFMAVPTVLETKWADLERDMAAAGIKQPRLAVTELQMFARIGRSSSPDAPVRLTHDNLVNPGTLAEALYDILIYHTAVRLSPFVTMVTHSATVNHGGGLRKERELVYANPCHYAQAAFAAFADAVPVAVKLQSPTEKAPLVMPDLRNVTSECAFPVIDALAALAADGSLLISIVHRGASGPIRLSIGIEQFNPGRSAQVQLLSAAVPWAVNSVSQPEAVKPVNFSADVSGGKLALELPPFSVLRVTVPQAAP